MTPRPVTASDVPEVVALVRQVLGEFGFQFGVGSNTDDEMAQLPASYFEHGGGFWVLHDGRRLLGTCGVYPLDPGAQVFELRKMYLHGEARGLGLGKMLLRTALDFTRARGARRVVLDTAESMTGAIAFYEANGFVRDDRYIHGSRCTRGYVLEL